MKISIIVPIYNVEKYIVKCIESLVNQSFDDYEILLINDGSPDNCLSIIKGYESKYPNLIKAIDKENGGYGSVLELGIKLSNAEYILVCDPDDYLASDALENLYLQASKHNLDIVVSAKNLVFEDSDEIIYDQSFNQDIVNLIDKQIYLAGMKEYENLYFLEPSPHGKLYKKELVKDLKFAYKVSYTDNLLYFYSLSKAKSVMYLKDAYAYYLINRSGNTRTDIKASVIDAWITVFNKIMQQVNTDEAIFYFRMFEAFMFIFYKIENIAGDYVLKQGKYEALYSFLKALIPHQKAILQKSKEYLKESKLVYNQKANLLNEDKSYKTYKKLYIKKLSGKDKSLKHRLRLFLTQNSFLNKLYQKYHDFAKYQYHKNSEKMILNPEVKFRVYDNEATTFFGYYDKPAINNDNVIYHKLEKDDLNVNQKIDIYLNKKKISETTAWNFQQGAMLSHLDDEHIIHNVFKYNIYQAKIINIKTNEFRYLDFPIYSLSKDGSFSLSLNFSRLAKLRKDYGYFNLDYSKLKKDDEDGIYYVDIKNNSYYLYLSLEDIKSINPDKTMENALHKVNHIEISPDDRHAIFLHRWFKDGIKYTRLMLLEIATKKLKILVGNKMVSHMCFINNSLLFGYLNSEKGDGYYYVDFDGGVKKLEHPLLIDDGHPTVYKERYIVVDTYPNSDIYSKLYLIDTSLNKVIELGKFFSPYKYQGFRRCDLHPRFNKDGSLSFDSVFSGKRQFCVIEFQDLIK